MLKLLFFSSLVGVITTREILNCNYQLPKNQCDPDSTTSSTYTRSDNGNVALDFRRNVITPASGESLGNPGYTDSGRSFQEGESVTGPDPRLPHKDIGDNYYVYFEASYRSAADSGTLSYGPYSTNQDVNWGVRFSLSSKGSSLDDFYVNIVDASDDSSVFETLVKSRLTTDTTDSTYYNRFDANWEEIYVDLTRFNNVLPENIYIQFKASTTAQSFAADWGIDNVVISADFVTCHTDSQCVGANTKCVAFKCVCETDNLYIEEPNTAGTALICRAVECVENSDCVGSNTICSNNLCACRTDVTHIPIVSTSGRSLSCREVQCINNGHCTGANTFCSVNSCQCSLAGFFKEDAFIGTAQLSCRAVECRNNQDCSTGFNTFCDSATDTCECSATGKFVPMVGFSNGRALRCAAVECVVDAHCLGANTVCSGNNLCQCTPGNFIADAGTSGFNLVCSGVECISDNQCVGQNTRCSNFQCACNDGFFVEVQNTVGVSLSCQAVQCRNNGDCSGVNTFCDVVNGYTCSCLTGNYAANLNTVGRALTCRVVECNKDSDCIGTNTRCDVDLTCKCNIGNFVAVTSTQGKTLQCLAVECMSDSQCSGTLTRCDNNVCACLDGFYTQIAATSGTSLACQSIECFQSEDCTGKNTMCNNGNCECLPGKYKNDGLSSGRNLNCLDVQCLVDGDCVGSHTRCNLNTNQCVCTGINYKIISQPGEVLYCEPYECVSDDECVGNKASCRLSTYSCMCDGDYLVPQTGTTGRNLACIELECIKNSDCLGQNTYCNLGGNVCMCASGLYQALAGSSGKHLQCGYVDSCATTTCNSNAHCEFGSSGATCVCNQGYCPVPSTEGLSIQCKDIDECKVPNQCHSSAMCENLVGTFRCYCKDGYNFVNNRCYRSGRYGPWINQGSCSLGCGTGVLNQIRLCNNPSPEPSGGLDCPANELRARAVPCNTHPCDQGCTRDKLHSKCVNAVQYVTGTHPKADLLFTASLFDNAQPIDPSVVDSIKAFVNTWSSDAVKEKCAAAACDNSELVSLYTSINIDEVQVNTSYYQFHAVRMHLQDLIDCNGNVDIEADLWDVYDDVCDKAVCVDQIRNDIMNKRMQVQAEMDRCLNRDWYSKMMESMMKKW